MSFQRPYTTVAVMALMLAPSFAPAYADQAECEEKVRAIMAPYGANAPTESANRFGTSVTKIGEAETRGYSLQTADGSLYFDENKTPVGLSFVNGDVYTTSDSGKTWRLVNSTPRDIMEKQLAGVVSQAEKATGIECNYDVDLDGKKVHHYVAHSAIHNTGQKFSSQYWVDAETGFIWRDVKVFPGSPEIRITVDAEPAPDMSLPDPKG